MSKDLPKLGLIAGSGDLPKRIIEQCAKDGRELFVVALEGFAAAKAVHGSEHEWFKLGQAGKILDKLAQENVVDLVMAGHVTRPSLGDIKPDMKAAKILAKAGTRAFGDDGLLSAVVKELEKEGFKVVGADEVLGDILTPHGVIGKIEPTEEDWQDIERGFKAAKIIGVADIGQAVIVQGGVVLGVEGIEGTDGLIRRCNDLHYPGSKSVLVKCKKPTQERRVDLPTIGHHTITKASSCNIKGIALEAGSTIMLDKQQVIRSADALGVFLIGVKASDFNDLEALMLDE